MQAQDGRIRVTEKFGYGLGDMAFGLPITLGLAAGAILVLALLLARR